jgi:hypothetical protein
MHAWFWGTSKCLITGEKGGGENKTNQFACLFFTVYSFLTYTLLHIHKYPVASDNSFYHNEINDNFDCKDVMYIFSLFAILNTLSVV